ncbi:MAG: hypothetical protein ACRC5R_04465 [Mycoplasmatales bacterium]
MENLLEWGKNNLYKKIISVAAIIMLLCYIMVTYYIIKAMENYSVSDISSALSVAKVGLVISAIAVVFGVIDYIIYPKERNLIMKIISLISFICALFWFWQVSKVLSGDNGISESTMRILSDVTFVILIVAVVRAISFLLKINGNKGEVIASKEIENKEVENKEIENKKLTTQGLSAFLKSTCLKIKNLLVDGFKKAKIVICEHKKKFILLMLILISFASVFIVTQYVIKTSVDVFEGVEVTFSGVSEDGIAAVDKSKLKTTENSSINQFLFNLEYKVSNTTNLKNDEVIILTAFPSSEKMKELKISVPTLTKEFTVTGLSTVPQSKADIPNVEKLDNILLSDVTSGDYTSSNVTTTNELVKTCYAPLPYSDVYYEEKYGTFLNIYKKVTTRTSKYSDPTVSEEYKVKGYTGLTISPDGQLNKDYSEIGSTSYKSFDAAEMQAIKKGLECN